ncbi:MAG: response regulator [Syntrophobacteria bacterium]
MQNSRSQSSRGHILIIDQNRDALDLLKTMLAYRGYRVTTAADGLEGLEKFRHGHFQLILTDLSIPRMSGWELCRIVKENAPLVPVVLATGLDFHTRPERLPFDAVISKPFHFGEFHQVVDSLIQCECVRPLAVQSG